MWAVELWRHLWQCHKFPIKTSECDCCYDALLKATNRGMAWDYAKLTATNMVVVNINKTY